MNESFVELLAEIFDCDPSEIAEDLSPDKLDLWDSLTHLRLVTSIEQEFEVAFTMEEVESCKTAGQLWAVARRGKVS